MFIGLYNGHYRINNTISVHFKFFIVYSEFLVDALLLILLYLMILTLISNRSPNPDKPENIKGSFLNTQQTQSHSGTEAQRHKGTGF